MKISEKQANIIHKAVCTLLPERCPYCDTPVAPRMLCCNSCRSKLNFCEYRTYAKGGFPCVSTFPYIDLYKDAVTRFKFTKRKQYAYQMARMMADTIARDYKDKEIDLITFVPLHRISYAKRGYNQSELLAKELGFMLGIPCKATLVKTKYTEPQHTKKKPSEREKNIKGAFRAQNPKLIEGKNILIIDDIITTGWTLGECANELMKHSPQNIYCATFAISVVKTT